MLLTQHNLTYYAELMADSARRDRRGAAWGFHPAGRCSMSTLHSVKEETIPAQAGIYVCHNSTADRWVPACAGMAIYGAGQ